jgi:hypothetical protein
MTRDYFQAQQSRNVYIFFKCKDYIKQNEIDEELLQQEYIFMHNSVRSMENYG